MKKILIALSLVIATSSAAFAGYSYGDGSPKNNADIYIPKAPIINNQNLSNNHHGYSHQNKTNISKHILQNQNIKSSLRQSHYGDGSPANQEN